MTSSGGNRFMRIVVDRKRIDSDWQLLGSVGHELQHAIEVLSDRFVTNSTQMYFFYRRHAPTDRDRFETQDAINAGIRVERECREVRQESVHSASATSITTVGGLGQRRASTSSAVMPSATTAGAVGD